MPVSSSVSALKYWRAAGVSLVIEQRGDSLPEVLHWGADLGELDRQALEGIALASRTALGSDTLDELPQNGVLPEASHGWFGTPGLTGHRGGRAFATRFRVAGVRPVVGEGVADVPHRAVQGTVWRAVDDYAELSFELELRLEASGLVKLRAQVTNEGESEYALEALNLALPVPRIADELLDHTGRHLLERQSQRLPFAVGSHVRESRKARAHDGTMLLSAGTTGFGYERGEVWGVHIGWSGNTSVRAERIQPRGERVLMAGELLLAGEGRLAAGESYTTPWVYASYGDGLNELSARFHDYLRTRPSHPVRPRKVSLNVWEAVYFDHNLERLCSLADEAAKLGVERFVLDDGWFLGRRGSSAGLGDWAVDPDVWPEGLAPLVDHVTGLGMEFGLWFEPEMINLDSELARAHPEWIMQPGDGRLPAASRSQHVLDLTNPDAWQAVFTAIDRVLGSADIRAVKWDHNRDLSEAGSLMTGAAAVHSQTLAAYRLWDSLRERHPGVEFESCSGGGGRPDLGIMERAERLWASDTIDALERIGIDSATSFIVPPELVGAHIGAARAHTTGRTHDLSFRAAAAVFGHLGIEWDLVQISDLEKQQLAEWIEYYRSARGLLHSGRTLHADTADSALSLRGVVNAEQTEAVYRLAQVESGLSYPPGLVRLPGLDAARSYRVMLAGPTPDIGPIKLAGPQWWLGGVTLTGSALTRVGLQAPPQLPEHAVLIHVSATE